MKRITVLVLLCTFLYSTGTVHAIALHFCSGDLSSVSFTQSKNQGCNQCKPEKKSCCEEVVKIVKSDQYNKADFSFNHSPIVVIPYSEINFEYDSHTLILASSHPVDCPNAPPSIYKEPLFIVYRSIIL